VSVPLCVQLQAGGFALAECLEDRVDVRPGAKHEVCWRGGGVDPRAAVAYFFLLYYSVVL